MRSEQRTPGARVAIALAQRLPVSWLRMINRRLYRTALGRGVLKVIWKLIAGRPVTIPRGSLAGYRFMTGGGQPEYLLGDSEPEVQTALERCIGPDDVLYDVGANVGFFTLLGARYLRGTGLVYAFEPIEVNVRALRRNIELNSVSNVDVHTVAVSDTDGQVRMSPGNDQATGHLADAGDDLVVVEATTIDSFVAAGHRPPSIVKIDVEGAENRVLAGMKGTLLDERPLVLCEVHYGHHDPRLDELTDAFHEASYREVRLAGGSMPHLLAVPTERFDDVTQRLRDSLRVMESPVGS